MCHCRNWRTGSTAGFARCRTRYARCPTRASFWSSAARAKLRTFLLSTVHREHFAVQSAATGFGPFLDKPYVNVWDKREKIHEILEENRLAPDETLFIGDMQHDIETARHGGIHSCAVLTGYNTLEQLRAAKPDLIVEHLGELREVLQQNDLHLKPPARRFEESHPPIVTVGGLIFNDAGQVLMIRTQKWSNLWGIPGGKIKWGETSVEALRREIKEETGLDVTDIEFVLVQDCIHSKEFYRDAHFVLLNYTCRCAGEPAVKLNDEAREFRWVTVAQALELPLNQPTRKLLLAVAGVEALSERSMSKITIVDLEVFYCVGVTERGARQAAAAAADRGYEPRFLVRRGQRPHRTDDQLPDGRG